MMKYVLVFGETYFVQVTDANLCYQKFPNTIEELDRGTSNKIPFHSTFSYGRYMKNLRVFVAMLQFTKNRHATLRK